MPKRILVGEVAKVVSSETATVVVTNVKAHPLYKKVIKIQKRYIAHILPNQILNVGQKVEIEESKPISKLKKWVIKTIA